MPLLSAAALISQAQGRERSLGQVRGPAAERAAGWAARGLLGGEGTARRLPRGTSRRLPRTALAAVPLTPCGVGGKLVRAGLGCGCKRGIDAEPPAVTAPDLRERQRAAGPAGSKRSSESFRRAVLWKGTAVWVFLLPAAFCCGTSCECVCPAWRREGTGSCFPFGCSPILRDQCMAGKSPVLTLIRSDSSAAAAGLRAGWYIMLVNNNT